MIPDTAGNQVNRPIRISSKAILENIPKDLQDIPSWIIWKEAKKNDGKASKVPHSPIQGFKIDIQDNSHHVSFKEVLEAHSRFKADGIGFVFINTPFTAIDIDKCILDGEFTDHAQRIIKKLNSYTEISPSGRGIRIIAKGKVPQKLRTSEIEFYPDWWTTMTGNIVEDLKTLRDAEPELLELFEHYKPKKQSHLFTRNITTDSNEPYSQKALRDEIQIIQSTSKGNRNNQLNTSAFNLGQLVGSNSLDEGTVRSELLHAALQIGLNQHEALTTINGGLAAGKQKPRSIPPSTFQGNHALSEKDLKLPKPNSKDSRTGEPRYEGPTLLRILGGQWYNATQAEGDNALAARIAVLCKDTLSYSDFGYAIFNGKSHFIDDKNNTGALGITATLSTVVDAEADRLLKLSSWALHHGLREESIALAHSAGRLARYGGKIGTVALKNALQLSASLLRIDRKEFETKPWIIGFQNCVVDHFEIRDHYREDYFLNLSRTEYHQNTDQTAWLEVLEAITGGNKDFQKTLQMVAGYALSGASTHRKILWLYGPRGTGKSTFQELLSTVLGEMAASISPEALNERGNRERLGAAIWNRRLAVVSEAGNSRISSDLLKTLSGGDSYAVRMLFKEQFQAKPTHVLLLVSNDPPRMDAYDDALKDRVIALPFIHSMKGKNLLKGVRLEQERTNTHSPLVKGFTTWAIEGMHILLKEGDIYVAPTVEEHTQKFWSATDPYSEFWEELDSDELIRGISKADLQERFQSWCDKNGMRSLKRTDWSRACLAYGLVEKRVAGGLIRLWVKSCVTN